MDSIKQSSADTTDHFEVNRVMRHLGFEWKTYDNAPENRWVRAGFRYTYSQAEAAAIVSLIKERKQNET